MKLLRLLLPISVLGLLILGPLSPSQVTHAANWARVSPSFADRGVSFSSPTAFGDQLYVAVAKSSSNKHYTEIWRSPNGNPNSWTRIITNGLTGQLGARNNTGDAYDLFVDGGFLYLTNNPNWDSSSCEGDGCLMVWRTSDGANWQSVSPNNFHGISQSTQKKTTTTINDFRSGKIIKFGSRLYVATAKHDFVTNNQDPPSCGRGEVFSSTDGLTWQAAWVNTGPDSGIGDSFTCGVTSLALHNNYLYASTVKWSTQGKYSQIWRSRDGLNWTKALQQDSFGEEAVVSGLATLSGRSGQEILAAVWYPFSSPARPAAVYRSTDGIGWTKVTNGTNISAPGNTRISSFSTSGNSLFIGTVNASSGTEIWHTGPEGPIWARLNENNGGFGSAANYATGGITVQGNYIYASVSNSGGVQVWRTPLIEPPQAQCKIDVAFILDISGSMNQEFINSNRSKLDLAKEVLVGSQNVAGVLDRIAERRNGSRIALLVFRGEGPAGRERPVVRSVFRAINGIDNFVDPNGNNGSYLTQMKQLIQSLNASGNTPGAHALENAEQIFQNRPSGLAPQAVLISDGVTNMDLDGHTFLQADVEAINLFSNSGGFKSASQVRNEGVYYRQYDERAGEPLADFMIQTDQLFTSQSQLRGYSIAMFANDERFGRFNISSLNYFGFKGGGQAPEYNTYKPEDVDQFYANFDQIFNFEICQSVFQIVLPPKLLITPAQVSFGGNLYDFINNSLSCIPAQSANCARFSVSVSTGSFDSESNIDDHYKISFRDWRKTAEPYVFKMTLREPITSANIADVDRYLAAQDGGFPTFYFGDSSCDSGGSSAYICLVTQLTANAPSVGGGDINLWQKIARKQLIVEGNVAAPGQIQNFQLDQNAIAVGGTINISGGSAELDRYLDGQSVKIRWGEVSPPLNQLFDRRGEAPPVRFNGNNFVGPSWNLNSIDDKPSNTSINSFSSPPEGKLWNVVVDGVPSFTLGNPNSQMTFSGSGTIVFSSANSNQPIDLTINSAIICQPGTRLAIITRGNITFKRPPSTRNHQVNCGSYTSLDKGIVFENASRGDVRGIFVAKGSVTLPNPSNLTGPYFIKYDAGLARNPTVLLKELLSIVFRQAS